jgi:predicted DNA-binding WGR domain protein
MINQFGAGKCSLCGSPGVSKATCPLNPKAKNPDPKKHPLANKSYKKVLPKDSKLLQLKGPGKDIARPTIKPPLNTMKIKSKTMKKPISPTTTLSLPSSSKSKVKPEQSKFLQLKGPGKDVARPTIKPPLNTMKIKSKTMKKSTNNFDNEWAKKEGNYVSGKPTKKQLDDRIKMIKEIYTLYKEIITYDKDYPNPNNWGDPPEYCYKDLLINMVQELKDELKQHKSKSSKDFHRLEFKEGNSNKFWQIKSFGTDVEINWGKIGAKGSTKVMKFDSKDKAVEYIEKQLQSKLKKGYKKINKSSDSKPKNKSEKKVYYAKFYNIATEIDPEYDNNGHLRAEMDNTENINKVLDKHPEFKPGDILFVGSTYETRQEYGFALFLPGYNNKKENLVSGEYGFSLPLEIINYIEDKKNFYKKYPDRYKDIKNPLENVRYSKLIQHFKKQVIDNYKPYPNNEEEIIGLFLGTDWIDEEEINEYIQKYKDKNLW